MTARPRWAAIATTIGALLTALPAAAEADTSTPGTPATGTPGAATCGTTIPGTIVPAPPGTTVPPPPSTTPTSGASSGTPAPTGSGTTPTVTCIVAGGNVYIFYQIVVTTTIAPISAPILNANGSITWVPAPTNGAAKSTGQPHPSATSPGGWTTCTAMYKGSIGKGTMVTCPKLAAGSHAKGNARIKLVCQVPRTATKAARKPARHNTTRHVVVYCKRA